uniref:Uncharacterized protein n=1 Tax=viral metagenome TaxID=1070528 RepID=A0A6C0HWT2_9ZZZZ
MSEKTVSNVNKNGAIYSLLTMGIIEILLLPIIYYISNKINKKYNTAYLMYGIAAGGFFTMIFAIIMNISKEDATENPDKKTIGPYIYTGMLVANIIMLIGSFVTLFYIILVTDKKNKKDTTNKIV